MLPSSDNPSTNSNPPSPDPVSWIQEHCYIHSPGQGQQKLEPYPYQVALWQDTSRQRIVLKSRQMGVSRALACEAAYTALNIPGSTVLLVSRGLAAARNVLRYVWQSLAPAVTREGLTKPTRRNTTTLEWEEIDSRIVSLPASQDAARSYSATAVYLDEAAYLPWAEDIYQALAPTVAAGGRITVVSTPHGRGNLFHRLWECEEGQEHAGQAVEDGWSRHRVHWAQNPRYTNEWAEKERKRHTTRSWAEEYELSFETSGSNVFAESYLQGLLRQELRPTTPPFYAGLDLARSADYTALALLDSGGQLILLERFNQAGWRVQVERVARLLASFPGVHVLCDATGVGDPVFAMLQETAARTALPGKRPAWSVESFIYTPESRSLLMQALVLAVEGAEIALPCADISTNQGLQVLLGEMRAFQWETTPSGREAPRHPPGGHDDCIQALALAWKALSDHRSHPPRESPALFMVGSMIPRLRPGSG